MAEEKKNAQDAGTAQAEEKKSSQATGTAPTEEKESSQATGTAPTEEKESSQATGTAPAKGKPKPPQYTAGELVAASEKALGVPQECAVAAFKIAGKTTMSLDEAKAVVEKFMEQEVK